MQSRVTRYGRAQLNNRSDSLKQASWENDERENDEREIAVVVYRGEEKGRREKVRREKKQHGGYLSNNIIVDIIWIRYRTP